MQHFVRNVPAGMEQRRQLGIDENTVVIGTIAVFRFQKRLKEWIDLFKLLQREGEQATWPKMSSIETHARVGKTIQHCLELLNYQQDPEQKAAEFIAV